jgi:hypothetical protein
MSSNVRRVLRTDYLGLIDSSGYPINPLYDGAATRTSRTVVKNASGNYEMTCTTNNGFQFLLPNDVPLNTPVVLRIKYRFVGDLTGIANWRFASSISGTLRAPTLLVTNDWVDAMYMTVITHRQCQVYSAVANPTVVFEIEKLEAFIGAFPYPPNYNATDIVVDQFNKAPYGTTAKRPVSPPLMTNYFDTTLNKLITWNGTNWRDGAGASV